MSTSIHLPFQLETISLAPPPPVGNERHHFRDIVKPMAGDLVISELMANPATEPGQEWFEITNVSGSSFGHRPEAGQRRAATELPAR